ncbi:hypothetical protein [Agrobacterium fabrum]|uniref:hypothetical protein n=1 Tax=Agrobacterium fabrum TaxID=1176649 RepID=UPI0015719AD0|nr:hypothetical protein [Agrobacterium fabrum]WCK77579.1 hypothetical protein G6L39_006425 [Agrobacterium fabrum]
MRPYPNWIYHTAKVVAGVAMAYSCYNFWPQGALDKTLQRYVWTVLLSGTIAIAAGFISQCIFEGCYNTWEDAKTKSDRPAFWGAVFTLFGFATALLTLALQQRWI